MKLSNLKVFDLYSLLVGSLQDLGFSIKEKKQITEQQLRNVFLFEKFSFVIDIRIGVSILGINSIARSYDYVKKLASRNVILFLFPEKALNDVKKQYHRLLYEEKVQVLVLTESWIDFLQITPVDLFKKLKEHISKNAININFQTIILITKSFIEDLGEVIIPVVEQGLVKEVVWKLDLFSSLSEIKNLDVAIKQVRDLASYLLLTQILLYHIYRKRTEEDSLPILKPVTSLKGFQKYFRLITRVGYHSIYRINVLEHISETEVTIKTLNKLIKAIKLLRAEFVTDDLTGRFFHEMIPHEARKILAAFYTHPTAATLLASLSIDSWQKSIIDPACGSGTLLVAAYHRKKRLYDKVNTDKNKMHKKFLEEDLTGIDIMPFAGHLTTMNLTSQNIGLKTSSVRIVIKDSLELGKVLKTREFETKGIKVSSYASEARQTRLDMLNEREKDLTYKTDGTIYRPRNEFHLKPVDIVLTNPPFTDRIKMPTKMKLALKRNKILGNICSHQINLWGYFLALSDLLVKPGGTIGAIIPINLARGIGTEKIRNFILTNYWIKYIVKPVADVAFSEGAAFRDIMLIAEKRKPRPTDLTKVLFLNKDVSSLKEEEVEEIVNLKSIHLSIRNITHSELIANSRNLMRFLMPLSINLLIEPILSSSKLIELNPDNFSLGLPFRPKGVADAVFLTRPFNKARIKNALTIIRNETVNEATLKFKRSTDQDEIIRIPKAVLGYCVRTNTGHNTLSIEPNKLDFVFKEDFANYHKLLRKKVDYIPEPFPWQNHRRSNIIRQPYYLIFPRKVRLDSQQTYLISHISQEELSCTGPSLYYLKSSDLNTLKIVCLFLNSVVSILQILILKSETLGAGWFELMKSDWVIFKFIDTTKITHEEKQQLLNLYDSIKKVEFPNLLTQLKERFWARIEIDKLILETLEIYQINQKQVFSMYDIIYDELTQRRNT